MRLVNLYQVFDVRARTTLGPIFAGQNEIPIARELTDHVNNPETMLGKNPEDFQLVLLGTQDLDTGRIVGLPDTQFVLECATLVKRPHISRPHGYIPPEG